MSIRQVKLSSESILRLIRNDPSLLNVPLDAKLIELRYDLLSDTVFTTILSDYQTKKNQSSADQAVNDDLSGDEMSCNSMLKLTPCKIVERIQKDLSNYSDMLNLTIKRKHVIAMPTPLLDAKWEEVNNLIDALGGRWIKKQEISYWEIPI